jgi:cobalt-precorrin 5A hydrolase
MSAPRAAIGVGLRSGASCDAVIALVEEAIAQARTLAPELDFAQAPLFTVEMKRGEEGLRAAAERLSRRLQFVSSDLLAAADKRVQTRSALSEKHHGVGSVAEAAALAGAGSHARLVLPRISGVGVTCAVAAQYTRALGSM